MSEWRLVASAILAIALGACGSSPPSERNALTYGEAWVERLPAILADAPEEQRIALTDGVVDRSEYERAFLAYRACIETAGVVILALERDDDGLIQGMSVADGTAAEDPAAVVSKCDVEHFQYVAEGWRVALNPGDSERQLLSRVAACLAEQGYDVPQEPADNAELLSALSGVGDAAHDAYLECVDVAQ
ncbi:MAG: hypothetical protein V4515_02990 [Chloroflexota bacterium]